MKMRKPIGRWLQRIVITATLALWTFALPQAGSAGVAASDSAVIRYNLSLVSPEQHLMQVQISLPPGPRDRELQLPVWNALYQIRDFSQFVNRVRARDRTGKPLAGTEVDKSRWRIHGTSDGAVVEYEIYLDSPGPFGAQLNPHHAFLNLAQVLMYPLDARSTPASVQFSQVPSGWRIATPLAASQDGFTAENYDRLVDSPVEMGTFQESDFDESGAHFRVIFDADPSDYDAASIMAGLHKIVAAAISWMDDRPFETYTFFYHFPRGPGGGGMEHAYSTAIELSADTVKPNLDVLNSMTAHEFFHLWNVKRIRPQSLEPIDYSQENYTRALWFSEGVTSTAEDVIELRAGLLDEKQFLARLGEQITELQQRPAHLTQSAEESSLDAWLEGFAYYRRPERSISYYNKGELLGIMLDLAVRQSSQGRASLREVLQWMNVNFAKQGRYFDDSKGVESAAENVSHADLAWFFTKYVAGTEEIPWDEFLRLVGLQVETVTSTVADAGFTASRNFDGPTTVTSVAPGSEAERAGLQSGDTILQLQGQPAHQQPGAGLQAGDTLSVKVRSRRGGERELKWTVGGRQEISYAVRELGAVRAEQRAQRAAWLKGEAQATSAGVSGK